MNRRAAILALVAAGVFASEGGAPVARATPPLAVPTRSPNPDAQCIGCHTGTAKEWSASLHRASFEDGSFQRGYAIEHDTFCKNCHAPETRRAQTDEETRAAEGHGVTCTSCHGRPEPGEPHPPDARAEAGRSCAGCHEFAFEGASLPPERRTMMQLTMTEHRESASADRGCASCHMKQGSHRFDVTRNPEVLGRALTTRIERTGAGDVAVTLTPREVGHAFPTGDMFRRLVLRIEVLTKTGERALVVRERAFERTFTVGHGTKQTVSDSRLTGPTTTRAALGSLGADHAIRVRVLYQRRLTAKPALGGLGEAPAGRLEDEIVLGETLLPPSGS